MSADDAPGEQPGGFLLDLQTERGQISALLTDDQAAELAAQLLSHLANRSLEPDRVPHPMMVFRDPSITFYYEPNAVVLSVELFGKQPIAITLSDAAADEVVSIMRRILAMSAADRLPSPRN